MLDICLLGTGGTVPLPSRRLAAALVRYGGGLTLVDCGEGTQVAMRERAWGLRNLHTILLTHMHADHVLGLPGLLLTLAFAGKEGEEPLAIYGPEPLLPVLEGLLVVAPRLPYPLRMVVLRGGESFAAPGPAGMQVGCAPLQHDLPCLAYSLEIRRAPRFDAERARALGIPVGEWRRLQAGQAITHTGRSIRPEEVLGPPRRGIRVVVAVDTAPTASLPEFIQGTGRGTDLVIADAMYGEAEDRPRRWESQHLTFAEAAAAARDGGARRLILTHFGPALAHPAEYLDRAQSIFPATMAGHDGYTESLTFGDE